MAAAVVKAGMRYALVSGMNITIKSFDKPQTNDASFFFSHRSRSRVRLRYEGRDENGDVWVSDANGSRLLFSHVLDARDAGRLIIVQA